MSSPGQIPFTSPNITRLESNSVLIQHVYAFSITGNYQLHDPFVLKRRAKKDQVQPIAQIYSCTLQQNWSNPSYYYNMHKEPLTDHFICTITSITSNCIYYFLLVIPYRWSLQLLILPLKQPLLHLLSKSQIHPICLVVL